MTRTTRTRKPARKTRGGNAGPISFFVALFIVALGAIQLVSTFHTYALNLAELNGLKREQAALEERKQDLENEIARWDDEAYVTAQARERLGFVFPGEQAVRVEHPEAVTGTDADGEKTDKNEESNGQSLPWYEELAYSFEQADAGTAGSASGGAEEATGQGTDGRNTKGTDTTGKDTSGQQ